METLQWPTDRNLLQVQALQTQHETHMLATHQQMKWRKRKKMSGMRNYSRQFPNKDMLLIMGDFNAKVGADKTNCGRVMEKQRCGVICDNALLTFVWTTTVIVSTIFPQRTIHRVIWKPPDGSFISSTDHILICRKWHRSLQDVQVCHRANGNSDPYLLTFSIKQRLRKVVKQVNNGNIFM